MSDEIAAWLLAEQIYQRDWVQTLIEVMERIQAGEMVTLQCAGCGERLGVYSVYLRASHCSSCERAAAASPMLAVRAA